MAFPPPVLAATRTNATPQLDTHPADHNALANAANDITARMLLSETAQARASISAVTPTGTLTTMPLSGFITDDATIFSLVGNTIVATRSGYYRVEAAASYNSVAAAGAATTYLDVQLFANGAAIDTDIAWCPAGYVTRRVGRTLSINAGPTIVFDVRHIDTAFRSMVLQVGVRSWLAVTYLGPNV